MTEPGRPLEALIDRKERRENLTRMVAHADKKGIPLTRVMSAKQVRFMYDQLVLTETLLQAAAPPAPQGSKFNNADCPPALAAVRDYLADPPAPTAELWPKYRDNGTTINHWHEYDEDPETTCCVVCGWAERVHTDEPPAAPPERVSEGNDELLRYGSEFFDGAGHVWPCGCSQHMGCDISYCKRHKPAARPAVEPREEPR